MQKTSGADPALNSKTNSDNPSSDSELIRRVLGGDPLAFEELMERYESRIYAFGYRMCGQHADALDLAQETFLTVYQQLGSLREETALTSWIYRIATNICLMRKRKAKRETLQDFNVEPILPTCDQDGWPEIRDWTLPPEEQFLADEMREMIEQATLALSPNYRAVFVLRDKEGLSTAETAEIMGLTEATVKVRLHRARLMLRKKLEGYFRKAS